MRDNLQFIINSKIELTYDDNYYESIIQDVQDSFFSISIPQKGRDYAPLRKGEKVEFIYYYNTHVYKFNSYVIDRQISNIPIILIEYPDEVYKIQRRKYVRVPIICSILYSKLEKECNEPISLNMLRKKETFKATVVDLSGGGMKIKFKEDIKVGDIIAAYIPINHEKIPIKGEVIRVEKDEVNRLNVCGVNFIELEKSTREKIIRFIFQIMREQMRRVKS